MNKSKMNTNIFERTFTGILVDFESKLLRLGSQILAIRVHDCQGKKRSTNSKLGRSEDGKSSKGIVTEERYL